MAISRPFLLALLGAVLLGATALAVQNARTAADDDAAPALVQTEPAQTSAPAPNSSAPADTLRAALDLGQVKSGKFAAKLGLSDRSQAVRFNLSGSFQGGAAKEMPKFDVHGRLTLGGQHVAGGFVSLGDKAYLTKGDTGWQLPSEVWTPVVDAVASGNAAQAGPTLQLHPETWIRDVKSEGTETVGGVETEHVSAKVDPKAVVEDISKAVPASGTEALNARQFTRAVKRAELDVWVGADDQIMRRLSGVVVVGNSRLAVDLRLSDVNKPQEISAPANVRSGVPGGAFGAFAEGLVGGASGGSVSLKSLTSPNPGRAARAVRAHKKVVILFTNSRGLDDRAMRSVLRSVDGRTKALMLTDDVAAVERYGKLVEDVGVSQTPSLVIIDRSGRARLIEGYVDSDTLTQAVADAR